VFVLLLRQAGFGAAVGVLGAAGVAWLLRKLPLVGSEHGGVLSLIMVSAGLALFATAGLLEGSGFLAIYLFGLRLRAPSRLRVRRRRRSTVLPGPRRRRCSCCSACWSRPTICWARPGRPWPWPQR
jgi:cell volume regulation protein A